MPEPLAAENVIKIDGEISAELIKAMPRYTILEEEVGAGRINVVKVAGTLGRDGWRVRRVPGTFSNHSKVRSAMARVRKLRDELTK